ncbi:transposase [Thiohalobacter thiocyanaticus]|uniref:Transposase n=1 Tax=Thiohalobacter thiocyanaticus TaxID=585455 RepID=A0A1Z4VM99_9GAMM|nr:transposase [Thiohalobacter thiocyanaticus]BAZ92717.1 transposase [Thiohalobacter thiocyanaticus]
MTQYRRHYVAGGTYFFTVTLADRSSRLLTEQIALLRRAVRETRLEHPFNIDAIVILPDHLHAIWTLPVGDADFSVRWRKIKARFSRRLPKLAAVSRSGRQKGERGVWQRRFWEHAIRNPLDLRNHIDYIHYNPVKHGHCRRVSDWPYSSFHRYCASGVYPRDWSGCVAETIAGSFGE